MSLKNPVFRQFSYTAPFDNAVKVMVDGGQYYITRKDLNESYFLDKIANCYLSYILFHTLITYIITTSQMEFAIIGTCNAIAFMATKEYLTPLVVMSLFMQYCLLVIFFIRMIQEKDWIQFVFFGLHAGTNQYIHTFYSD